MFYITKPDYESKTFKRNSGNVFCFDRRTDEIGYSPGRADGFLAVLVRCYETYWLAAVGNPGNSVAAGLCRDFYCFRKSPDYSGVYAPVYISLSAIFLPEYCLWNEGTGSRYQSFQCADHSS